MGILPAMASVRGASLAFALISLLALGTCVSENLVAELGESEGVEALEQQGSGLPQPAILQFSDAMLKAMAKVKSTKTNWQQNLETVRNGVVQLRVVQEKFLWTMPYRAPLRETIFGSGWFIDNKEFGVNTNNDILIVTNAHVAKQASSISVLIPELGQEPIAAEAVGVCVARDIALIKVVDPKRMMAIYKTRTGEDDIIRMRLGDSDKM